jgi:hypothetical protein
MDRPLASVEVAHQHADRLIDVEAGGDLACAHPAFERVAESIPSGLIRS